MGHETKKPGSRDRILERRAAFVAAALASVATGCKPQPCLSVAQEIDDAATKPAPSATTTAGSVKAEQDAGPEPPPVPCLSPMPPPDAGSPAAPAPCLKAPDGQ